MFLENDSKKLFIFCGLMQSIKTPESRVSICGEVTTSCDFA